MPRLPDPPDEHTTFERLPAETPLAFRAFAMYRDMGPARSMDAVRKALGKEPGYLSQIEHWSTRHKWGTRARKWDDDLDRKAREVAEARMPLWEQRRQASLEANLHLAAQLRERLREMIDRPLTREQTKEIGGKEVTIIEPAGWNWNTIINGAKVVAELEAETIAEGLMEAIP